MTDRSLATVSLFFFGHIIRDRWTEILVAALSGEKDDRKTVFEPAYHVWKSEGAGAALELNPDFEAAAALLEELEER